MEKKRLFLFKGKVKVKGEKKVKFLFFNYLICTLYLYVKVLSIIFSLFILHNYGIILHYGI